MSDSKESSSKNQELIRAVWDEARDLVKRLEGSTVQRFSVEAGDTKIEIERRAGVVVADASAGGAAAAAPAGTDGAEPSIDGHEIKAPLVGTFYRASQPGASPFVNEGDTVDAGQTVGIVEAMKLMNQVTADVPGKISKIFVDDGQWVEFEQTLMVIEPAA